MRIYLREWVFAFSLALAASCQTTVDPTTSLEALPDEQLDQIEIVFSRYPLPPPQRSIDDIKTLIESFDFEHKSACGDGEIYQVALPDHRLKYSDNYNNVRTAAFMYRDAASKALLYGDFEAAMQYLDDADHVLRQNYRFTKIKGNLQFAKSIIASIIGDTVRSNEYYSLGSTYLSSSIFWSNNEEYKAALWRRETAAYHAYAQSRYRESENRLRLVRSDWSASGGHPMGFLITSDLAGAYPEPANLYKISKEVYVNYLLALSLLNQNRFETAEAEIRSSIWYVEDAFELAWIIDALAVILHRQGRYADAEWVLRRIVDFFASVCAPDHFFVVLRARLRYAQSLVAQGKWTEALPYFDNVAANLDEDLSGVLDQLLLESLDWPIARMLSGDFSGAYTTFGRIMTHMGNRYGTDAYITREAAAFDALNTALREDTPSTLRKLDDAVGKLLATSQNALERDTIIKSREHRTALLMDRYLGLLEDTVIQNHKKHSFLKGQAGKRGSVQAALTSSALRARVPDPELRSLLRKFQDILNRRTEIDRIYAALAAFKSSGYKGPGMMQLDAEIQLLEAAKLTALERLRDEYPKFLQLIENKPLEADDVPALLTPDESVVLTRVTTDYVYVWAIDHTGELSMARTEIPLLELESMVAQLRRTVDPGSIETINDIPAFDTHLSHSIYRLVLEPVREVWQNSKRLIVIPDGALRQLPFSLLVTKPSDKARSDSLFFDEYRQAHWLAKTHSIMALPSLSSLSVLRGFESVPRTDIEPFVGFGDPIFAEPNVFGKHVEAADMNSRSVGYSNPGQIALRATPDTRASRSASLDDLPPLPDTRDEILSIAKSLGVESDDTVFLGADAHELRLFARDLSNVKHLAFATHGLVAGDLDGLNEPALALSHPAVLGDEQGDGLLRQSEIIGLKLNADLVILSACNTASADGSGAEAVSGLGRAFFLAGSKALLVSHWPVHSRSTADLMSKTFALLARENSGNIAESVRLAKIDMIENGTFDIDGKAVFSYAHPIFWAPFTLIGDGT